MTDLHAASVNTYVSKYNVNQTSEGKVTSGEFIDVIRGLDLIEARIAEGISELLFNAPKVPFTNDGVALVKARVANVMQLGEATGIIAPGTWTVTAPNVRDVSTVDKANRNLPDVNFAFDLAGAIHSVTVYGTVSL